MIELTPAGQTVGLISLGLTFMGAIVRHLVLDKEKLKEHKEKIKDVQSKMKEAQKNKDMKGMQDHQSTLMSLMGSQMKHSFKPMIFTFIPFILVFNWLRSNYGEVGTVVKLLGFEFGWFGWYFITAMLAGIIINKIMKNT